MKKTVIVIIKLCSVLAISGWVGLFIWTHQAFGYIGTASIVFLWAILTYVYLLSWIKFNWFITFLSAKFLKFSFFASFMIALITFFSLTARNDRAWQPEVSHMLDYSLSNGKTLTLYNVRNFDWQSKNTYQPHWETREYDLDKLQSIDYIASYWMGDPIAHTLVSFGFSDGKRVAVSIEIRKENGEEFSTWGGFFRNYEMIIIAADEKDIIYTRSNIRHEQVYIYPLTWQKEKIKQLFLAYLNQAHVLKTLPIWYNTLTNNCTTAIYQLVNRIEPLPLDYRILASGYSPNYLYDINAINHQYTFSQWRQKAYINPKSDSYSYQHPINSADYSALIRRDF